VGSTAMRAAWTATTGKSKGSKAAPQRVVSGGISNVFAPFRPSSAGRGRGRERERGRGRTAGDGMGRGKANREAD
jgi:hypothetical protein